MKEVRSSNIHSIDHQNGTLMIRFCNKDGTLGNLYHYADVPEQVHADLMAAFLAHIRDNFKGVKQ